MRRYIHIYIYICIYIYIYTYYLEVSYVGIHIHTYVYGGTRYIPIPREPSMQGCDDLKQRLAEVKAAVRAGLFPGEMMGLIIRY